MALTHINFTRGLLMKTITVGELRTKLLNELNALDDSDEVYFGAGDLSLHRPKDRGPVDGRRLVQIEFNEVYSVTADPDDF
jgi:hypothetical protein